MFCLPLEYLLNLNQGKFQFFCLRKKRGGVDNYIFLYIIKTMYVDQYIQIVSTLKTNSYSCSERANTERANNAYN